MRFYIGLIGGCGSAQSKGNDTPKGEHQINGNVFNIMPNLVTELPQTYLSGKEKRRERRKKLRNEKKRIN